MRYGTVTANLEEYADPRVAVRLAKRRPVHRTLRSEVMVETSLTTRHLVSAPSAKKDRISPVLDHETL
jgi:hypothetical protein